MGVDIYMCLQRGMPGRGRKEENKDKIERERERERPPAQQIQYSENKLFSTKRIAILAPTFRTQWHINCLQRADVTL